METLFDGIPLDQVSTSMTINGPAAMLFCFYVAAAEKQGVPIDRAPGDDPERHPQGVHGAARLDLSRRSPRSRSSWTCFEWAAEHTPKWNTISISGYHIREAGATAAQELAFTLANGFCYVEHGLARGLDVDQLRAAALVLLGHAQRLLRGDRQAARRAPDLGAPPARALRRRRTHASWKMRFHCQTAGVTLTAQQPMNNIVRVAYQALAAVLGGTQSLHTNSLDETLALPTEESVQVALRTQQILAYETGVPNVVDPLGGSYYVEALTDAAGARGRRRCSPRSRRRAAWCTAIESGWFQRQIAQLVHAVPGGDRAAARAPSSA